MSPALTTFLFEAVNFLILAGTLGWLFFRPVRQALDERRQALAAEEAESRARLAEAESARAASAREREALAAELDQQRARARAQLEQEREDILVTARDQAERERAAARQALEASAAADREQLGRVAADAAREVVARLLSQLSGGELDELLLRAACRKIHSLDGAVHSVTVESASPLPAEQQRALDALLPPSATYRIVPELIAGVRVLTDRGMVDASAAGLAAYAGRVLANGREAPR